MCALKASSNAIESPRKILLLSGSLAQLGEMSCFLPPGGTHGRRPQGHPPVESGEALSCGVRRRLNQEPGVKVLAVAGGTLPIEPPVTTESITRSCSKNTEKPL